MEPPFMSASVEMTISRDRDHVFSLVTDEDAPPKLLRGYGPIPEMVRSETVVGPWGRVGATRKMFQSDGHYILEEITDIKHPTYFSYKVSGFTCPISLFAEYGEGQWSFDSRAEITDVRWTFTFKAKNHLAKIPLWLLVTAIWKGNMHKVVDNIRALAEANAEKETR